jgi:hypothetical protein
MAMKIQKILCIDKCNECIFCLGYHPGPNAECKLMWKFHNKVHLIKDRFQNGVFPEWCPLETLEVMEEDKT